MVYSPRKASYNSSNFHSLSLFATSSSMNVLRCQNSNKTQDNYASIIFSQASWTCFVNVILLRVHIQYTYSAEVHVYSMRHALAHGIPGTPHTIHTSAQCKRLIGQNFLRSRTVPPITCTIQRHSPEYVVKSCVWSVSKWNNHNPGNLTKFYTEMKLHGKI